MRKFAVFDIDGTVIRDSLFIQTVDELVADGKLPRDSRARLDKKLEAYKSREHSNAFNDFTQEHVDVLFSNMRGLKVSDYHRAVDKIIKRTKTYTYVYTRELIKKLKRDKYFLIALSGSENYAVEKFAYFHGFDLAVGEKYLEKDGFFTGKVETVIYRKDTFVRRLVKKHKLTFKGSVAVGDGKSDGKMLAIVENPIAFNPELDLFNLAKKNGWKIVVERKNVIYHLEPGNGTYLLAKTD